MRKKLTITVDEEVYHGLHRVVGRRRISRFLNELAKPHVVDEALEEGYRAMAADEERERDAIEWSETLISDVADDPR
jgi:predicted CopG family antitoxin